ncbi:MAG TPA: DUF1634 domain-containing protein [Gammaproteobacteria bacterium]|nr:DUF1634 domain-containing protein [Gammaproteobacteria bacterium]
MKEIVRERRLLNIWILRISIALCALLIAIGLIIFFVHGSTPILVTPSGSLREMIQTSIHGSIGLHASAFLDAAIIVLLLTPMARLVAGIYVSARVRDWLYVGIGMLVLALVIVGVIAGQSGV